MLNDPITSIIRVAILSAALGLAACTTGTSSAAGDEPPAGDLPGQPPGNDPPGDDPPADDPPADDPPADDDPPQDGVIDAEGEISDRVSFGFPELEPTPAFDLARLEENTNLAYSLDEAPSVRLPDSGSVFYEGTAALDESGLVVAVGNVVMGVDFGRNQMEAIAGNFVTSAGTESTGTLSINTGDLDRSDDMAAGLTAIVAGDLSLQGYGDLSLSGPIDGELRGAGQVATLNSDIPGVRDGTEDVTINVQIIVEQN